MYNDGFNGENNKEVVNTSDIDVIDNTGEVASTVDVKAINRALVTGDTSLIPKTQDAFNQMLTVYLDTILTEQEKEPFKKGGPEISFNPDFIMMRCRQMFNEIENVIFDIVAGMVSSDPHATSYTIWVSDVRKLINTKSNKVWNNIKKSVLELRSMNMPISCDTEEMKHDFGYPFFVPIVYSEAKNRNDTSRKYITFTPSPLLRLLLASSTKVKGGFFRVDAAAQINSKFCKTLYYYMEAQKGLKNPQTGKIGSFSMSYRELRELIGFPLSYSHTQIIDRIIEPCRKQMDEIEDIQISFTYETKKEPVDGRMRYNRIDFCITRKGALQLEQEPEDELTNTMNPLLLSFGYSEVDAKKAIKACRENNRDLAFLAEGLSLVKAAKKEGRVKVEIAVLLTYIKNGNIDFISPDAGKTSKKKGNKFHNFDGRNYSKEELEEMERKLLQKASRR